MAQLTESHRIPQDAERAADPFPFELAPPSAVRRRRAAFYAFFALVAYSLALVTTLPARLLLSRAGEPGLWLAISGTVWQGEAAMAHGHALRWRWAPAASLGNLAYTTDVTVVGPDTDLDAKVSWRRNSVVITNLEGTASASLISAVSPSLPFLCDFPMRVNIDRLAFGGSAPGASGEVHSSAGLCGARGGVVQASAPIPPLTARATMSVAGSSGWVAPRGSRNEKLMSFTATPNGQTSVSVAPAAAAIFPGVEAIQVR